ncbi:hypothetical protein [Brevibacterium gallinarum]|uniref:Uncharacterized protein n=1 Tax=Brevibacterium gallinarum TaxID=2762220 RepID=A0ABR8WW65_9MICO|nr:hypothetical protein [Brevibacterium gallinarum]MBD8021240.1 hypothetical protein [Brevibacterium gallinarum]
MSVRFAECEDPTFAPRMVTVAALGWTAIVIGWFTEITVMPGYFMDWRTVVIPALVALGVAALAAIVYWLSLPYGWIITTVAVAITVAVSIFAVALPAFAFPVVAAPVAAVLVAAVLWLPPIRRYLQHKPR